MIDKENIPKGLEYQDQYWEAALVKIKRKERAIALMRWFGAAAILAVAVAGTLIYQQSKDTPAAPAQISYETEHGAKNVIVQDNAEILNSASTDAPITDLSTTLDSESSANGESSSNPIAEANPLQEESTTGITSTSEQNPSNGTLFDGGTETIANNESEDDASSVMEDEIISQATVNPEALAITNTFNQDAESAMNPAKDQDQGQGNEDVQIASSTAPAFMASASDAGLSQPEPASPEGSMLENQAYNWSGIQAINKIQTPRIASKKAHPGLVLAGLKAADNYFPIAAWSIQATLGNGFETAYGSRLHAVSWQPNIGVALDKNVTEKWSWNLGLRYQKVGDVLQEFSGVSRTYDFSVQIDSMTIATDQAHFVALPFSVARRFNERHQFRLGLAAQALITTRNNVSTSVSNTEESFGSIRTNVVQADDQTELGYTQGWKDFGAFAMIGYDYFLKPELSLGVHYEYGLTDVTENDVFGEQMDRNSQLLLQLRLNLINR